MADVNYIDVTALAEVGGVQSGDVLLLIRKAADGTLSCYKVAGENFKGDKGDTGKSAYEVAVEKGYTGTEDEWNAHIAAISGDMVTYDATNGEIVINA